MFHIFVFADMAYYMIEKINGINLIVSWNPQLDVVENV